MLQKRMTLSFDSTCADRMKQVLISLRSTHGVSKSAKLKGGKLAHIYSRHVARSTPTQKEELYDCMMPKSLKSLLDMAKSQPNKQYSFR